MPRPVPIVISKPSAADDQDTQSLRGFRQDLQPRHYENRCRLCREQFLPQRVGVFVDDMPQNIVTRVYNYSLDYVQLHGNESPVMIDNLRRTLDPDILPGVKIIKTLSVGKREDVSRWQEYLGHVDMFLFDTQCKTYGGSGEQFDWTVLEAYDGSIPFLLSGGIGPEDAERVRSFKHPLFAGVDLNSRFEVSPAVKDVEKLRSFIQKIRQD